MRNLRKYSKALFVGLFAFAVVGCSDSDNNNPTSAIMDIQTQDSAAEKDIVDTAIAAGNFNTLVAAVQAAGLEETLRGEGPFTVFAPTDAAFKKLPDGTVENLLKPENLETLQSILLFHVSPGEYDAAKALEQGELPTVNGEPVSVYIDGDSAEVNDANIIITDIQAGNGIIHVIDAVILPSS